MAQFESISFRLKALRERSGLSVRDVAKLLGVPTSTYSTYERTAYKKPYLPLSLSRGLQGALVGRGAPAVTKDEVLALFAPPDLIHAASSNPKLALQIYEGDADAQPSITAPLKGGMPLDVPVLGTAMGGNGDGAFLLNQGSPVDWTRRAPGIMNNRSVFAIYVEGESMAPRYEPGDLVYIDENRPARVGDDVVLVVDGEDPGVAPRSYLKRLVRRTADRVIVEQYNPAKELAFPARAVKKIFRVLRTNELMGI